MAVITINGQIGCAVEIGQEAARRLKIDYVDRQVLAEAGRRVGASADVLAIQEGRPWTRMGRVSEVLERAFIHSGPMGAESMSPTEWEAFMSVPYPMTAERVDDKVYFDVVSAAIRDLANHGNVVIVGRAGNMVLHDMRGALHVRTVAPMAFRVAAIMKRMGLEEGDAEAYVTAQENARVSYYRRFYKVDPNDPLLYDLVVNVGTLGVEGGADIIARAATLKEG